MAAHLQRPFGVSMFAYLDDWLLVRPWIPADALCQELQQLGLAINFQNSIADQSKRLIYLGLNIDPQQWTITPTPSCI